jgi:hypothetical protein
MTPYDPDASDVRCPRCKKLWPEGCEQAIAVMKRGVCISCLTKAGECICMEPYEFAMDVKEAGDG